MRSVSGLERIWLAADQVAPPFAIQFVLEDPAVDVPRWRAALAKALAANPGFSVQLEGRLRGTRWVPGPSPEILEVDWDGRSDHPCLWAPMDAPMQILIGRGCVVFRALHALTDGRGLLGLVSDATRCHAGAEPIGSEGGPTTEFELASRAGVEGTPGPPNDQPPLLGEALPGLEGPVWGFRLLPSVSSPLQKVLEILGPGRFAVPVDLRRYAPGLRSSANLTGVLHLELDGSRPTITEEDARLGAAHALGAEPMRGLPLFLMRHFARKRPERYGVRAAVSNLGRHDLQLHGRPARAWLVPPYHWGSPLLMILLGDREHLAISALAPRALGGEGRLDALLDRIAAQLR